jgi:hypothetical protein
VRAPGVSFALCTALAARGQEGQCLAANKRFNVARPTRHHPALERELLRKSVVALGAEAARCTDCERTPLVGERVHHYEGGRLICELCRMLRREAPERTEFVHGVEHGNAVRITDRRAA